MRKNCSESLLCSGYIITCYCNDGVFVLCPKKEYLRRKNALISEILCTTCGINEEPRAHIILLDYTEIILEWPILPEIRAL